MYLLQPSEQAPGVNVGDYASAMRMHVGTKVKAVHLNGGFLRFPSISPGECRDGILTKSLAATLQIPTLSHHGLCLKSHKINSKFPYLLFFLSKQTKGRKERLKIKTDGMNEKLTISFHNEKYSSVFGNKIIFLYSL